MGYQRAVGAGINSAQQEAVIPASRTSAANERPVVGGTTNVHVSTLLASPFRVFDGWIALTQRRPWCPCWNSVQC